MCDPEEGKGTKNVDLLSLSQFMLLCLFTKCTDYHKIHF